MSGFVNIKIRLAFVWQLIMASLEMNWRLKYDYLAHLVSYVVPILLLGIIIERKIKLGFVNGIEYYLPYAAFISYEYQKISSYVAESIHFGDMGIHRLKPYSFYSYNLIILFASNVLPLVLLLPVVYKMPFGRTAVYLVGFALGVTLRFTWCYLIGILAYSFKRMDNILTVESLIFMALGGLIPLSVLPTSIASIVRNTPYWGMYHLINELSKASSTTQLIGYIGLQLTWIVVLRLITYAYESRALKAYDGATW